jgi:hypothetical protein
MSETVSLGVGIEVVLRDGPTFETIAGLCKMAVEAEREACASLCSAVAAGRDAEAIEEAIRARGQT